MDEIKVPVWYKDGSMIVRRDCLPHNHPEHTYNYIKNQLGLEPEKYGVYHPLMKEYEHLTKEELISKLIELEKILSSIEPYI